MDTRTMRIGMIGLDTSHVTAFAELLHNADHPYHVPGGRITAAFEGGSPDFELSYSRVKQFSSTLSDKYGVPIRGTIEEVAEESDAILLGSVDGRIHLEQFARIAPYGKPVFIDKPFAVHSSHAAAIAALSEQYGVPLMSCSALRYAEALRDDLREQGKETIIGMDCYGPMSLQPTQPGLFWYGIHTADMLYAAVGTGCAEVTAVSNEDYDLIVGRWQDGRIGTMRGNRRGNNSFGAVVHRLQSSRFIDVYAHPKPYYAGLLEEIMSMFATGKPPYEVSETLEIVRFLEAANESRETGRPVQL